MSKTSIGLYDDAIIQDLRNLTEDTRISIAPVENVFRTIGKLDFTEDKIELPLISVTRTSWSINRPQHSQKFEGITYQYDKSIDYVQRIQVVPVQINYVLDVWTRTREENDAILRELIFYYLNHPTLKVLVPYGADYEHEFNIFLNDDIEDNSDVVEHKNRGEYFRQTLSFYTDDAHLWKTSSRPFTKLDFELFVVGVDDQEVKDGDYHFSTDTQQAQFSDGS